MSNDDLRIANFDARVTALYQSYGEIEDQEGTALAEVEETVDAILWAWYSRGGDYDPSNDATWGLAHTRRKVDNLLTSVREAIQAALYEAEGVWGGVDEAPTPYRGSMSDLRDLRSDLMALKADIDRACADVDAISK